MKKLWIIGLSLALLLGGAGFVYADDGKFILRQRPLSLHEEYEITEHGEPRGTIRERPLSLYPEYEIRSEDGNLIGTIRKRPLSLFPEYEIELE